MRPVIRKRLGRALASLPVLALIWALFVPLPYVIVEPGPTFNVLGKIDGKEVIERSDGFSEESVGVLDMTTVSSYGSPGNTPDFWSLVEAFFSTDKVILPLDSIYPIGKTSDETKSEQATQFQTAEDNAIRAALHEFNSGLGRPTVQINLDDVGGPSGGLIFALGVIDKLSPGQLTGGKSIAGTGTISADGKVGPIGGIRLKMLGAQRAGDRYFLAPKSNCNDVVGFEPPGLKVIPVETLRGALNVLDVIASDGDLSVFPVCSLK